MKTNTPTTLLWHALLLLAAFLLCGAGSALAQSSTSYIQRTSVMGQGGGRSESSSYATNDTVGQPAPPGTASSPNYLTLVGFVAGPAPSAPVGSEEDKPEIPSAFQLNQNYPNPFNPSTNISFDMPVAGDVLLTIYDVLGQPVRRLHDGPKAAGSHMVRWDGQDEAGIHITSGIYFCRLAVTNAGNTVGHFEAVRGMIFMK